MKFEPTLHKLSNGVTVILDPMDLETVYVSVTFKTGSGDETQNEYGITHFCEHMFCKGSTWFATSKERKDFLENYGGTLNALTSRLYLRFYGRIIAENRGVLIDVLSDMLKNALFDEKQLEIERGAILDELRRAMDKPQRQMYDFGMKKMFNLFVPNGTLTLGNSENIKSFTREQLLDFTHRRMSAKNCIITISGSIDSKDEIIAKLEDKFAFLPTHAVEQNLELKYTSSIAHCSSDNSKNVHLNILFQQAVPDTFENIYKNKCIGRFKEFLRREMQETLRHKNGLVYGTSCVSYGNPGYECYGWGTETAPENVARVVELMAQTASHVYNENPITQEELDKMFNLSRLGDADFLESSIGRNNELNGFYRFYNRLYDFNESVNMRKSITPEDVVKYTRGMFDGPMSIITYGADFDADLKQIWIDNFK